MSGTVQAFLVAHQNEFISFALTPIEVRQSFYVFRSKVKLIWGRANNELLIPFLQEMAKSRLYAEKPLYTKRRSTSAAADISIVFTSKT